MDTKNTNFRVILALTTLPQDVDLNGASLKVTVAGSTKTIPLTNKEATPLDFSGVQLGSKIEFGLEDIDGFMFGYSELKIPTTAFEKNETEVNEQLRFYLINKEKDSFVANVYVIFLNKGLFKEKAKERGTLNKTKTSPIRQGSFERQNTRSPSGSPTKRSPSKGKTGEAKTTEKNFQAYLNRLVDSHSVQLKTIVDEHNSINEYIHINKVQNNLPQNFAQDNLETYSPTKLKSQNSLSRTMIDNDNGESSATSFYKVNRFATEESRVEEKSVLRDLSPMGEREKKSSFPNVEEISVRQQQTETSVRQQQTDRSPSRSPIRSKATLERKASEGSFSSPTKRKQLVEALSPSKREREVVVDTSFYNAQINNLNNVIVSQNSRISDLEIHQNENAALRAEVQKSEVARRSLQESVLETTNELKQENKELERQVAAVVTEKEGLLKKIADLQNTVHGLSSVLATTKAALQEKEDVNIQNSVRLVELSEVKQQFKKIQDALIASENQKAKDQETYKASLARFELSLQDTERTINLLNQEKKKLTMDIHQVQQELGLERANHQATQNDLLLTRKKLENAENYKDVIVSLESQRDQLTQQLADSRLNHTQTQQLLQDSVEKLAARQRDFETNEQNFNREVGTLAEKLSVSENKHERVTKELNEQKLKVSQLSSNVSGLEQMVCVKEDVGRQLEATTKQLVQVVEDRNVLRAQLNSVVVNQDQTNVKLLEVEKTANQLRQTIEEQDQQIEHLTYTVIALRESQEMYLPTKGDVIDNAVADYINTTTDPNRLKLLFIRETEGVYQFGTKRVYCKLEGGKILIRVGGGFLTMDEFIEQYGPLECEKLSRNDPIKKLSMNIAVNKTLIGKCVNQMERAKNQPYEYRTDASNMRIMNSSPSLQRLNSKGDY